MNNELEGWTNWIKSLPDRACGSRPFGSSNLPPSTMSKGYSAVFIQTHLNGCVTEVLTLKTSSGKKGR